MDVVGAVHHLVLPLVDSVGLHGAADSVPHQHPEADQTVSKCASCVSSAVALVLQQILLFQMI